MKITIFDFKHLIIKLKIKIYNFKNPFIIFIITLKLKHLKNKLI